MTCKCHCCEMLMTTPMKRKSKNPDELIQYMKMGDKIELETDISGEYQYYIWTDGYKCMYNAEESLNIEDLQEGNCRVII